MATPIASDGTVVTGNGDSVTVALPAKTAGDLAQWIIVTPGRNATTNFTGGTTGRVYQAGGLSIWRSSVGSTAPAGATSTFKFPTGDYIAFAQIVADGDPLEPSLPTLTATVVEGDGKVTVNWVPSDAAAFASYVAKLIAPAAAAQQTASLPATARQAVFDGLTNGVEHTFQIDGTTA